MNNQGIRFFIAMIALGAFNNVFSYANPAKIILKNGSAFDIIYKPMPAEQMVYKQGSSQEFINEENVIKAGERQMISTYGRYPMRLSIKRYGYGSSLSSWTTVPDPLDLAKEQLDANQMQDYYSYTGTRGKMPIIIIKTGYTGGWSFGIGYVK